MAGIRLGSFHLAMPLDSGGFGEVWRGWHVGTGVPVAVKLIPSSVADRPRVVADFEREVRAVAGLDHPAVLYVFDVGRVGEEAALASGGALDAGSPWLAMELCSSSLHAVAPDLTWEPLKRILLALLDGLAHAHSRGVLHRDIKPANVLIATSEDLRPGVKLADFGIAHALQDDDEDTRRVGTPRYMAPEQLEGRWNALGPWTDLYAVGALTWRLVTGRRPWPKKKGAGLYQAMLSEPMGWPGARFAIPDGLTAWMERLLHKQPVERYQLAADAAAALRKLPEVGGVLDLEPSIEDIFASTSAMLAERASAVLDGRGSREAVDHGGVIEAPAPSAATVRLHGAGLGLLAVRRPEMMGRLGERNRAWRVLQEVKLDRKPQCIQVHGPPGMGRSRFLDWLSEAAETTGQALTVRIRPRPAMSVAESCRKALRQWFRIGGLSDQAAVHHLEGWLRDPAVARALAGVLRAESAPADHTWQTTVGVALAALSQHRPVVVRIDDSWLAPEIVGFLEVLLRTPPPARLLVVVDAERPYDGLDPGVQLLLGPLDPASLHRLTHALVDLDPDVTARLVARAQGSPDFLVSVLCWWAQRQQLSPGRDGFVVRQGEDALPPKLAVVANTQIEAVLDSLPVGSERALERAAVLGQSFEAALWQAVDDDPLGTTDPPDPGRARVRTVLISRLLARGLLTEVPGGWRFASVPFREALLTRAGELRRQEHHAACALHLAGKGSSLELGRHRLLSGDAVGALEPLARGARDVAAQEGPDAGLSALTLVEEAIEGLKSADEVKRWRCRLHDLRSLFLRDASDPEAAEREADAALKLAEELEDLDLQAVAWSRLGSVAARQGDLPRRRHAYLAALELAQEVAPGQRARWHAEVARTSHLLGDVEAWREHLELAAAWATQESDPGRRFLGPLHSAALARADGRFSDALSLLEEAETLASAGDNTLGRLMVCRHRGHVLAEMGDRSKARSAYLVALELAVRLRSRHATMQVANAVLQDLHMGRAERGASLLEQYRFLSPVGEDDGSVFLPLHVVSLAVLAHVGAWDRVRYHLQRASAAARLATTNLADALFCYGEASRLAEQAGQDELARVIARQALRQSLPGAEGPEHARMKRMLGRD